MQELFTIHIVSNTKCYTICQRFCKLSLYDLGMVMERVALRTKHLQRAGGEASSFKGESRDGCVRFVGAALRDYTAPMSGRLAAATA